MGLKARSTGGNKGEQAPAGTHMARLVGLVDLGHQPGYVYEGKQVESKFKILFLYELVDTAMEDGRPFWVEESVNVSDYEPKQKGKVSSTMMLRVRTLDGYDGVSDNGNNLAALIGKTCMVTSYQKDNGYAAIQTVAGMPQGMNVTELKNTPVTFNMDETDVDTFLKFPEWRQTNIKRALDFEGSAIQGALLAQGHDTTSQPDV